MQLALSEGILGFRSAVFMLVAGDAREGFAAHEIDVVLPFEIGIGDFRSHDGSKRRSGMPSEENGGKAETDEERFHHGITFNVASQQGVS